MAGSARAGEHGLAPTSLFDEPFLRRLEALHLIARRLFAGRARGQRRGRRVGSGIEIADHRDYQPGDDLRYLDWGAFARLSRPLVRLFEEDDDLCVYLLVDASGSMATRGAGERSSKLAQAQRLAAALAYVALAELDRVSVVPLGGASGRPPPAASASTGPGEPAPGRARSSQTALARGRAAVFRLLDALARIEAGGPTDLDAGVRTFLAGAPRAGLAIVLSDFFDPAGYARPLERLTAHGFEVAALQLVAPSDAVPDGVVPGDEVDLVDAETGERLHVAVTRDTLAALAGEHARFGEALAAFCAARGIAWLRAETEAPFDEIVLRLFRRRGLLA